MGDHTIREGDVLVALWGYGQINVDYYLVLKRTPKMAEIQQVETQIVEFGGEQRSTDLVLPNTHIRVGKVLRRKVSVDERTGREQIVTARWVGAPICRRWGGERNHQTNYAYMH